LQKIDSLEILDEEESDTESVEKLVVSVTGQVENPGVYELKAGSIINDLINRAGGFTKKADSLFVSQQINLAEKLSTGMQIYIPSVEEKSLLKAGSTSNSPDGGGESSSNQKVNINTATASELETLTGVGPSTAQKIIENRPYEKIEDLLDVSGIGESTLEKIRSEIVI
jgi:competence protein ComEA